MILDPQVKYFFETKKRKLISYLLKGDNNFDAIQMKKAISVKQEEEEMTKKGNKKKANKKILGSSLKENQQENNTIPMKRSKICPELINAKELIDVDENFNDLMEQMHFEEVLMELQNSKDIGNSLNNMEMHDYDDKLSDPAMYKKILE